MSGFDFIHPFSDSRIISNVSQSLVMVFFPLSIRHLIRGIKHSPSPIHHRIFKATLVHFTIVPNESPISIQQIIIKVSLVGASLCFKYAITCFLASYKVSLINNFIPILQNSFSVHQAILETALVLGSIGPLIQSLPMLLTLVEFSLIIPSIKIGFSACSMGQAILELAFIFHSFIDVSK